MTIKLQPLFILLLCSQLLYGQDIVINEILASSDSTSGLSDDSAQYEDFIELYNTGSSAVDLSGWSLSDDILELDKWSFPTGTTIDADSYLIIWCDNDSFQNGLHAYFKLAKAGEIVTLSDASASVVDQVPYDQQTTNTSWSRVPNGTGAFEFDEPSFSCTNDALYAPLLLSSSLVVNEVLSSSDSTGTITDPSGKVEDWVELFNKTSTPIDLYGYFLSDDVGNKFKWKFPYGTTLAADDYLIIWCDNDQEEAGLHSSYNLSASGESMLLSYHDGSIIDITTWAVQISNSSHARLPNGTGTFQVDLTPSFNDNNGTEMNVEEYFDSRINAYPSPVKDELNISISPSILVNEIQFQLVDLSGQLWIQQNIHTTDTRIDIPSGIPAGLYFIVLDSEAEKISRKIIIE